MTDEQRRYVKPDGHAHGWHDPDCTPVSPTTCLTPTTHGGSPAITDSATGEMAGGPTEHLAGFHFAHDREGFDVRCEGGVNVDPHFSASATWQMTGSLEGGDLTLSPSILCRAGSADTRVECGFHGFVRDGAWVPA